MSNARFGKTMENLRKRSKIAFVGNVQQAESIQKPSFKSFNIVNENLVSVSFKSSSVLWDKPPPVGASILDLSKLSLYKLHYEQMVPRYSAAKLKLAYKDTDSLLYCVETENLYQDMAGFKHLLDLSDYAPDHFLYNPTNKKVPLTMTDELQSKVLKKWSVSDLNYTASTSWVGRNRVQNVLPSVWKKRWSWPFQKVPPLEKTSNQDNVSTQILQSPNCC